MLCFNRNFFRNCFYLLGSADWALITLHIQRLRVYSRHACRHKHTHKVCVFMCTWLGSGLVRSHVSPHLFFFLFFVLIFWRLSSESGSKPNIYLSTQSNKNNKISLGQKACTPNTAHTQTNEQCHSATMIPQRQSEGERDIYTHSTRWVWWHRITSHSRRQEQEADRPNTAGTRRHQGIRAST